MKLNKVIIFICSLFIFLTYFSGIKRHDVKEEKYLKLAQQKQFDCVGRIYKDTSASGSCVLISDRFILSAAHVFIDSDTRPDTMEFNGQTIVAYVTYNHRETDKSKIYLVFKGQKVKVKKLILHPNYLDSLTKGSCDIALLELEQPLKNITPPALPSRTNRNTVSML